MSVEIIKSRFADVVDFPQKGIVFRDLTTVFKDCGLFEGIVGYAYCQIYAEKGITKK